MDITLNHTIVPARNHVESAKWYEEIFGFEFVKVWGPFAVVRVNSTFSLDFMEKAEPISSHHYAFKVSDSQFDEIFGRVKAKNIDYCSDPSYLDGVFDQKINNYYGGRGVYFKDPVGHALEIITADYDLNE